MYTHTISFPPPSLSLSSQNLKQLQIHKSNIFELSLPTRVTKIIEARPNTTIGEAISNVLKKYKYSLELMEVKMTNTLQVIEEIMILYTVHVHPYTCTCIPWDMLHIQCAK